MKKIYSLIAFLMLMVSSAMGQSLSIADFSIKAGETKDVAISLVADAAIYGIQTDVVLSDGLTLEAAAATDEAMTFAKNDVEGATRMAQLSLAGDAIAAGEVITLTVKAADTFEGGTIQLTNTRLTTSTAGAELKADDVTANVTVEPATEPEATVLENIAALKAFEPTESGTVKVTLNDVKVTGISANSDVVVLEDASAANAFENLGLSEKLQAGQTLNGELVLTVEVGDMWGEVTYTVSLENATITEGEVAPMEVTEDNVLDYLGDYSWRLVKFTGATISVVESDWGEEEIHATIPAMGTESIGMMDTFGAIDEWPEEGDVVDIVGFYVDYYGSFQYIQPISITKAEVPAVAQDIEISPAEGDIAAALAAAEEGIAKVGNITINLTEGVTYTVSSTLTAYKNFKIQGNGAVIDASELEGNLVEMYAEKNEEGNVINPEAWTAIEYVSFHNATIKGLKKALFYSGVKQYDINWLTINNCYIELAADATTIDFTKGSVARNFNVEYSTIYAPTATTKQFYSSQSGQKATEADAEAIQSFIFKSSTLYNLAPGKNFFSHRQSNQKWLTYDVQNNIFVNCGKSGQVIKGMNGGQSGKNPTWSIKNNAFNFDGADTSADEATGDDEEAVEGSIAGVVTFTDAANGDFSGVFKLAYGVEEPASLGDARWTLTYKETSELMAQAQTLALDKTAVAVGKLIAAIAEADESGDESNLQAAIDQFNEDNKDQEKDETAKVGIAAASWTGASGLCATNFAPAITTYDGRTAQLAEKYETTVATTGELIYQNITGLENGQYKVGFYANAFYTSGRGFDSDMEDGAEDVAYVFANDQKEFIVAKIATSTTENNFRQFDVEVTDGAIKLGLGKEKAGTNWHTIQIYQLTWFTTAKAVYANDQAELKALVAEAEALAANENKTEGKDALNTAIATAKDGVDSNWYNIPEIEEIIANLKAAIATFKQANYYIDLAAGKYYVIDTATGKFMAAGHDWGTHGIVNEYGLDLTLTPNEETRTVTIDSQVSNGGDKHFLGSDLYMDSSAYGWALDYQGFGFYIVEPNSGQYISLDADENLVLSATPNEWIIVTAEGVKEERLEELEDASPLSGVDATWLLQNPNFNRNDLRVSAWTVSEDCTNKNLNGGNNVNNCAESYHSVFTISQLIEGAPAGTYQLTAQGFYRQDGEETEAAPYFFMQTSDENVMGGFVPEKTGEENSMSAASESFTNGLYTIEPIGIYVGEGEQLTIGVKGTALAQWVIFDNFKLTYFGAEKTDDLLTTAISEVNADAAIAQQGIYNLAGQKVLKAQKGLYIINGKKQVVK